LLAGDELGKDKQVAEKLFQRGIMAQQRTIVRSLIKVTRLLKMAAILTRPPLRAKTHTSPIKAAASKEAKGYTLHFV